VERSGVDAFTVRGHKIFVKRDDQLRLPGTNLSGNKARKMYALHRWGPGQVPRMLVSYGGAQSNAMLALALVAKAKGVPLTYFTKPIPRWLRETPSGNYAEALALGANITAVSSELYKSFEQTGCPTQLVPEGSLWIPQGGACALAEPGVQNLASEIKDWLRDVQEFEDPFCVVLPAGTGTTALFLARHLEGVAAVVAIPCVGDAEYLQQQMSRVDAASGDRREFPAILDMPPTRPFGVPDPALLEVWETVRAAGLEVDLLYAPRAWEVLLQACDAQHRLVRGKKILYVHSGGLEGVGTMLARYRRQGYCS